MKCYRRFMVGLGVVVWLVVGLHTNVEAALAWQQTNGPYGGEIHSIAIDPTNGQTMYAGTSAGAFKTSNGGVSWTALNNGITSGYVNSFAIDPTSNQTLYAGSWGGGAFKSTNGGEDWVPVNNGFPEPYVLSLAIATSDSQTLYATTGKSVYKTINGGSNWTEVNNGLSDIYIHTIIIDPTNSQTAYAGTYGGLFKTTDGGVSWTAINGEGRFTTILALAIDPGNPQIIYAGSFGGGIFKTVNGGATWTALIDGSRNTTYIRSLAIDPASSSTVYAGTYGDGILKTVDGGTSWTAVNSGLNESKSFVTLVIDPTNSQALYVGTDAGIFKTANGGGSWTASNNEMIATYITSLAIDSNVNTTAYAGTRAGVFKTDDGGATWAVSNNGMTNTFVNALVIDPNNSQTLYAGTFEGDFFKSTDAGRTWTKSNIVASVFNAIVIDPTDSRIVYGGTEYPGLLKSNDGGITWAKITTDMFDTGVNSVVINPANSQIIYIGTRYDGIFRSDDGGQSWRSANIGLVSKDVNALVIDPTDGQTLYAGLLNGGAFKTTNGGDTWTEANNGLPPYFIVNSLVIDPACSRTIFAATDAGVFRTDNGGDAWMADNNGLGGKAVHSLAMGSTSNGKTMYAGTYNSGIFKTEIAGKACNTISLDSVAPTNGTLIATQLAGNQVKLDWSGFSDAGSGIDSYKLVRGTTLPKNCSGVAIATLASDALSYTDTGSYPYAGSNAITYFYRLCAVDAAGNMNSGAIASAMAINEIDPPAGTVTINSGDNFTNKLPVTVTIDATDVTNVAAYCISNSNTCTAWIPVKPMKTLHLVRTWSLAAGKNGPRSVTVRFKDGFGTTSTTPASASIVLDTVRPVDGVLTATVSPGTDNSLELAWTAATDTSGSGIKEHRLYHATPGYPVCKGTPLVTVPSGEPLSFTHTGLSAAKRHSYRVCATDNAGNVSLGATGTAKPTDTTIPVAPSIKINNDAQYANKTLVALTLGATDAGGISAVCLRNQNVPADKCVWKNYAASTPWTLTKGDGEKIVYARFKDTNGNLSDETSDAIMLDTKAPSEGAISINSKAIYTNSRDVILTLNAVDSLSGVATMQISESSYFTGAAWESYETTHSYTLATAKNGTRTVYARFRDAAGNVSTAVKDTIILDTVAPAFAVTTSFPEPTTLTEKTIRGTKEVNGSIEITANTTAIVGAITAPTPTTWSCVVSGLAEGENLFTATETDLAGNTATKEVPIAYAPFRQADLAGTWSFVGGGVYYSQGAIIRGNVTVDANGIVLGGYSWTDGVKTTVTGGLLAVDAQGQVSGVINLGAYSSITLTKGTLNYSRQALYYVGSTTSGYNQLGVAYKQVGMFETQDLVGDWYVYGAMYGALNGENYGVLLYGNLTVGAGGFITKGRLGDPSGYFSVTGGQIQASSQGQITGGIGLSVKTIPLYTYLSQGNLSQSKTMFQVGGSMDVYGAGTLYESFVGIKAGGVFTSADLEGVWDIKEISGGNIYNSNGNAYGTIELGRAGKVLAGSSTNSHGESITVTGGTLSVTTAGLVSGAITVTVNDVTSSATILSGKVSADKTEFVSVIKTPTEYDLVIATKRK